MVVPAEIPVTRPVLETVATAVLELAQGVIAVEVTADNCVVEPTHVVVVPSIEYTLYTATRLDFVHPLMSVYVMVLVPDEIPVNKPVEDTVTTDGLELTQGFISAGEPEPVN